MFKHIYRGADAAGTCPVKWDEQLWSLLVGKAVARADGSVEFVFRGEKTVKENNA